ncbi:hypothetical protein DL766_000074 [Monosporascus sp. MC13-8B]|uniref:Uncharacterized protein n=1 Tax=Monosporascus cannonballus TaxID=155416 RepID=A0ABY0GX76_9PEZI|nr:hypothetical protein DL762_008304 [Monosporascus cannonballus]RYO80278.1 hypothetical protein DL763_008986 [Monosporascus cannonballus]RYP40050.1 hypothetical protein DL766_000074 [Monosporascus sp. MC13-8B]
MVYATPSSPTSETEPPRIASPSSSPPSGDGDSSVGAAAGVALIVLATWVLRRRRRRRKHRHHPSPDYFGPAELPTERQHSELMGTTTPPVAELPNKPFYEVVCDDKPGYFGTPWCILRALIQQFGVELQRFGVRPDGMIMPNWSGKHERAEPETVYSVEFLLAQNNARKLAEHKTMAHEDSYEIVDNIQVHKGCEQAPTNSRNTTVVLCHF